MWSILLCKLISVFIDLNHGEFFFSIASLFKTASFLKLLLILGVNEPAADRSREKVFDGGKKNDLFFVGAIGHFGQCVKKRGLSRADLEEESQ